MKIKDITSLLEKHAPLSTQESYDNSGLIVGDSDTEISGVLISLDCVESVIDEAIAKGCNLVISHHPIVFKGLKKINGKNYVERTVIKAIKNDIALYAIHTNLDNYRFGVNAKIGELIGLKNLKILSPVKGKLYKLVFFSPIEHSESVKTAVFQAGAGHIGDYSACSFTSEGTGTFAPEEDANPFIGEQGRLEKVQEHKVEMLVPDYAISSVLNAMKSAHPYEEVAYDLIPLANENNHQGAGMIGELAEKVDALTFLKKLKETFECGTIKYTELVKKEISTVAFCGGAGSFLLQEAKRQKADIYITGDMKYHEFFDAENQLIIADIGHYESEQFTPNLIHAILKKNFINFALHLSEENTNPINYL